MQDAPSNDPLDFASRHITSPTSAFDAGSAISRLDSLLDDIDEVAKGLTPLLKGRLYPAFFEITQYYLVGFVTCLEWHAKSRLFDMLTFYPEAIDDRDLQQTTSKAKIRSMVSKGLTIPHLLVGSTSVSSKDKYVSIIERVLASFGAGKDLGRILDELDGHGEKFGSVLNTLFIDRNLLVHEISLSDIGHPNIRHFREFGDIKLVGKSVRDAIMKVEAVISSKAPLGFPNVLDEHGTPVSNIDVLKQQIADFEATIRNAIQEQRAVDGLSVEAWDSSVARAVRYAANEERVLGECEFPGWRYFDPGPGLLEEHYRGRLSYLRLLSEEIVYDDDN